MAKIEASEIVVLQVKRNVEATFTDVKRKFIVFKENEIVYGFRGNDNKTLYLESTVFKNNVVPFLCSDHKLEVGGQLGHEGSNVDECFSLIDIVPETSYHEYNDPNNPSPMIQTIVRIQNMLKEEKDGIEECLQS